jgi:hypothetical protein
MHNVHVIKPTCPHQVMGARKSSSFISSWKIEPTPHWSPLVHECMTLSPLCLLTSSSLPQMTVVPYASYAIWFIYYTFVAWTNKSELRCPPQTIYSRYRLHAAAAVGESSWRCSTTDQTAGRVHRRIEQPVAFGDGGRWRGALGDGRAGSAQILCLWAPR